MSERQSVHVRRRHAVLETLQGVRNSLNALRAQCQADYRLHSRAGRHGQAAHYAGRAEGLTDALELVEQAEVGIRVVLPPGDS